MPADTLSLAAIIGPVFAPDPGLLLLVVAVLDGFIGDPPGLWARQGSGCGGPGVPGATAARRRPGRLRVLLPGWWSTGYPH